MNKGVICIVSVILACTPSVSQAKPSRFIATYSQEDVSFSETIQLGSDGKYTQAEKQIKCLYRAKRTGPLSILLSPPLDLFPNGYKRSGRWVLRDKPGGLVMSIPADGVLPKGAVAELSKAMPFGYTWENQVPQNLQEERAIEADAFQPVKADR